jgi:transcriptional regulator with XRE-family HTH domain
MTNDRLNIGIQLDTIAAMDQTLTAQWRFGELLRTTRIRANVGLRELARRAGTSHATISAYENGRKVPSIATFVRLLEACGFAVDFELSRRVRLHNGVTRGQELAEVLTLAEQFPANPKKSVSFPRFDQTPGHRRNS